MENDKLNYEPIVSCFDADFIMWYVCPNKKDEPIKTLEDCIRLCDDLIFNINRVIKADFYVGFLTVGKCFRYRVNPDYKANRKGIKPDFLNEVKQHLIDNHGFTWNEEYEADDLVVSYKNQFTDQKVIIVSPDKDILTSVNVAFNPRRWEYNTATPDEIIKNFWKSMITGDTVDGIKGIPGKGEKHFNKMYNEYLYTETLSLRSTILEEYITHFGEYEGIKEFTKNYLSLKMIDNIVLKDIKLKEVPKPELL